jgi:hypothetical protein
MAEGPAPVAFRFLDRETEGDIVTIEFEMPAGRVLVMAEVYGVGCIAFASRLHIQSSDRGKNAFGWAQLRVMALAALEWLGDDYDELVIKGAVRTSGANPGRQPGGIRFTRRLRSKPNTP